MNGRFSDIHISRESRYTLGRDGKEQCYFLSIPVANRMVDYEEYYSLTDPEYALLSNDEQKAKAFADACRNRDHDARLILKPGADRGVAV
jgi:hypothetical protein